MSNHFVPGQILLKYEQKVRKWAEPVPHVVYVFDVRADICASWVAPEHVDAVLAMKGGCCGKKKPGVFTRASEVEVEQWVRGYK